MLRRLMIASRHSEVPDQEVTWSPVFKSPLIELTADRLGAYRSGASAVNGYPVASIRANLGLSSGKWYFEISTARPYYPGNAWESAGLCSEAFDFVNTADTSVYIGFAPVSYGHCYRRYGGGSNGVQELRSGVADWVGSIERTPGVLGIAVDLDAGKAWCVINGAWTAGANPLSTPSGRFTFAGGMTMYPAVTVQDGISPMPTATHTLNAGLSPFSAVPDAAFDVGGILEGFNKGWGVTSEKSTPLDNHIFDGERFIAARVDDGYTRFYSSQDGQVFEYLGGMAGANMFSQLEAGLAKGANCYASFPKYLAATSNTVSWYSATIPDFTRSGPPQPWASAPITGTLPLCIAWDPDNSRFVRIMADNTVTWSADGLDWSILGAMVLPELPTGWTWYTGMRMELFRSGGYWYALHSALGSRFQADSTLLMRSVDLLGPWAVCPGTGFYSPPDGVAAWDFFMLTAVAVRGTTMIITASGRRSTPAGSATRELILRSTGGLNFALVREASSYNMQGYNDFTEVKPVGASGFVATGAGGLLVSSDDGLTWSRTAMAPAPTALRSDGRVVVGTRSTGANGAAEGWHTVDGQTWTKSTVRRYNSGLHRHWRLRAIKAAGDVTFAHLAFFSGASKLMGYTKSQGAGTGLANVDNADAATFWGATATELAAGSAWVAYDFGSAQDVTAVKLQAPSGDNSRMPSIVEIEASEDGVNWRPVWFEAGLTWSAGESKRLEKAS